MDKSQVMPYVLPIITIIILFYAFAVLGLDLNLGISAPASGGAAAGVDGYADVSLDYSSNGGLDVTGMAVAGSSAGGLGSGSEGLGDVGGAGGAEGVEAAGAGGGISGEVSANIRITAPTGQVMPEGSIVAVSLAGNSIDGSAIARNATMDIKEFMSLSERPYKKADGFLQIIDYEGPGYTGQNHTVPLGRFGIDLLLPPGQYVLSTEVNYQGLMITSSERLVEVT